MENPTQSLASEFDKVNFEDWMKLVEAQLKKPDAINSLITKTYDDIDLLPLYDKLSTHPSTPGKFPFTRSCTDKSRKWNITQIYTHPDLLEANRLIREDLNKGVTDIRLQMSEVSRRATALTKNAFLNGTGLECYQLSQLESLLSDIQLERVPIELQAGASFYEFSTMLFAIARQRQIPSNKIKFSLNADPAAAFAEYGELPDSHEVLLDRLAQLAHYCSEQLVQSKAVGVSGVSYHNAGASQAQEIGAMLATGVTYLRSMVNSGMGINQACSQIRFNLTADIEFFQNIAKFRVLRELWAQVCKHSGAKEDFCKINLDGETSYRMLSRLDPWVNLLRNTLATSSAAIGNAGAICCHTFDSVLGNYSTLGHRMSRNTQLLLQDESNIHNTIDPTGGSFFIENYCEQLRKKSWTIMQNIEAQGGIFEALQSGDLQQNIAKVKQRRSKQIQTRKQALTGASEFADPGELALDSVPVNFDQIRNHAINEIRGNAPPDSLDSSIPDLIKAYISGASTQDISTLINGKKTHCTQLVSERLPVQFEALREASELYHTEYDKQLSIVVITIGSPAQFNARLGFTKNFFAAGGINVETMTYQEEWKEFEALFDLCALPVVVICSNDENYNVSGERLISTLRNSGVDQIYIVGNAMKTLTDVQLTLNCNIVEILQHTHKLLGVSNSGVRN